MQMTAHIVDSIRWKARQNYWKVLAMVSEQDLFEDFKENEESYSHRQNYRKK